MFEKIKPFKHPKIPFVYFENYPSMSVPDQIYSTPDGKMIYTGDMDKSQIAYPTPENWKKFIKAMESIPSLNKQYHNLMVDDGYAWDFKYDFGGHSIRCRGINAEPKELKQILLNLKAICKFENSPLEYEYDQEDFEGDDDPDWVVNEDEEILFGIEVTDYKEE